MQNIIPLHDRFFESDNVQKRPNYKICRTKNRWYPALDDPESIILSGSHINKAHKDNDASSWLLEWLEYCMIHEMLWSAYSSFG